MPQRLAVTEPDSGHALHGLMGDRLFDQRTVEPGGLILRTVLEGEPGYPFRLTIEVEYSLEDLGISTRFRVRNESDSPAPVALGVHPYLRAGGSPVTGAILSAPTTQALLLDDTDIPRGEVSVRDTHWNLRSGRAVDQLVAHGCYELETAEAKPTSVTLMADDGITTELWAESAFRWLQVYRASREGSSDPVLAVEPMTAPPNALRTGRGLRWLQPHSTWELRWGIRRRS